MVASRDGGASLGTPAAASKEAAQQVNPRGPANTRRLFAECDLCLGERIFDQGVVQGPKDQRLGQQSKASELHLDGVPQDSAGLSMSKDLEPVPTDEPSRCCELKGNPLAGVIAGNGIADRSVASEGTWLKRAVEANPWPIFRRPEWVVRRGQSVQQIGRLRRTGAKTALMHVEHTHGFTPDARFEWTSWGLLLLRQEPSHQCIRMSVPHRMVRLEERDQLHVLEGARTL